MGVSITAKHSKYDFTMGYGAFFNLRKEIALALDEEFGKCYEGLIKCWTLKDYEKNDNNAEYIINNKHLDEDIIDFLYQPDQEGSVSYKTCKKIYDLIKDVDYSNKYFQYVTFRNPECSDYEAFKHFLKECYSYRRKMIWY